MPNRGWNTRHTAIDTMVQATTNERLATQEEMEAAKLPLQYRDFCAHLLIPLNECRRREYYLPWKCERERHRYEKCQYQEYKKRLKNKPEPHER